MNKETEKSTQIHQKKEGRKIYENVDQSILTSLPNPDTRSYEIKVKQPEITFLGVYGQPDFASLYVLMYPAQKIIELKSLKIYLQQYRDVIISYERLLNLVYDHMLKAYKPNRLRLVLDCNPRGGISSRLTIDSDWSSLGGEDRFQSYGENLW